MWSAARRLQELYIVCSWDWDEGASSARTTTLSWCRRRAGQTAVRSARCLTHRSYCHVRRCQVPNVSGDHLAKGIWRQKHVDQFEVLNLADWKSIRKSILCFWVVEGGGRQAVVAWVATKLKDAACKDVVEQGFKSALLPWTPRMKQFLDDMPENLCRSGQTRWWYCILHWTCTNTFNSDARHLCRVLAGFVWLFDLQGTQARRDVYQRLPNILWTRKLNQVETCKIGKIPGLMARPDWLFWHVSLFYCYINL